MAPSSKRAQDFAKTGAMLWVLVFASGCSVDTAKSHFKLADKLWMDRKYAAAVSEFEKVTVKDPQGKLGLQALYRGATTQNLFLSQYGEAVRKLRIFSQAPVDSRLAWNARLQIGDILFSKTEQFDQAVIHYQNMLKDKPEAAEAPEILFRIGKSWFYMFQFDEAIKAYREIVAKYPQTEWEEKALYQVGVAFFTRGEQLNELRPSKEPFREAIEAFNKFVDAFPKSPLASEARFGIASCLEEMDQLERAFQAYSSLKSQYPAPRVVEIKLARLKERMLNRGNIK